MVIVFTEQFKIEFHQIFDIIAYASSVKANNFRDGLLDKLKSIVLNPYSSRKSKNFNNEDIRDFIYKGYAVPYYIKDDKIYILGVYKSKIWN